MRLLLPLACVAFLAITPILARAELMDPALGHIGCTLVKDKSAGIFTLDWVAFHGPADLAGMKKGDRLTAIDGASTQAMTTEDQPVRLLNGEIGSTVTVTLQRTGGPDLQIRVKRTSFRDTFFPAANANDCRAQYVLAYYYCYTPPSERDYQTGAAWCRRSANLNYAPAQVLLAVLLNRGLGVARDYRASMTLLRQAVAQGNAEAERELAGYYYANLRYEEAYDWFCAAAQQDDAYSERYLGFMYGSGLGVLRDDKAAVAWYLASARHGDSVAERHLGFCYKKGLGVDRDDKAAFAWYYAAARQDDADAEENLADLYQEGLGCARDNTAAFNWYYAAARQDDALAELRLGAHYELGRGVAADDKAAFAWYYTAAQHDIPLAESNLGLLYLNGRGVAEDDKAAFAWLYAAARHDEVVAERFLGYSYRLGQGVPQDDKAAFAWYYTAAAHHGDRISERYIGAFYRLGRGVAVDDKASFAWYYAAAMQDDVIAETNLGFAYQQGRGVPRDDKAAFAWYYAAARQDNASAEQYLGSLYGVGRGVPRDYAASFAWLYRSAELHDHLGEWNLSYLYLNGQGVPKDTREALKWARKALAAMPDNERLKEHVALLGLRDFVENSDAKSLDLTLLLSVFHRTIIVCFLLTAVAYAVLGSLLGLFTFRNGAGPPHLVLALGWISFYLESQFVAVFASFLLGKALTADFFILMIAVWSALPVVIFTLGSNWRRFWRSSTLRWRSLAILFVGCALVIAISSIAYDQLLTLVTGAHLTDQSTKNLFAKAKESSPWLALVNLGLVIPVAEEILFRGYLYDALKKRWSDAVVIIVTALTFAVVHFQLEQFSLLFGIGLVLGWAKMKTGSLRLPVLIHAANNSLVIAFAV